MIPELGHLALILAACLAAVQAFFGLAGAHRGTPAWIGVAKPVAIAHGAFLILSFAALAHAFVIGDFSVVYVARNSNSLLPLQYRFAATWGAHEGSLLLWVTILGLWTVAVASFSRDLPAAFVARVLGVMGLVSFGFTAFLLITSNPFVRLLPAPAEGLDLNPLLQDAGLVLHPPILYTGYVGFAVAFGFAIAALLDGRFDSAWARWVRPWTLVAWTFLTLGIALGSWWAYYELGWGGWWFWDPVENASFMPWLAGTALLHSLAVSDHRGVFRSWTVLLAVTAFALSLLGTFLVRSGVLTSVHAFAADPARGVFVLVLLGIVVGGSLVLYALKAPRMAGGGGRFTGLSRETALLSNNVLLAGATASVLLGTVYPLVVESLGMGKLSVGAPYFNSVFVPIALVIGVLLPIGSVLRWRRDDWPRIRQALRVPAIVSGLLGVSAAAMISRTSILPVAAALVVSTWILLGTAVSVRRRMRQSPRLRDRLRSVAPSVWGMAIAHAGLAMTFVGVAVSSAASHEAHRRLAVGSSAEVAGYRFAFTALDRADGPNYAALEATVQVTRRDRHVATLRPQKRQYRAGGMPMTEAGIDAGPTRDLYVSLGERLDEGDWSVRLYVKPFVRWIWIGAMFMALGGLVAAGDRRYWRTRPARASLGDGAPAAAGV